jgi:hypothetical protein
MPHKKRRIKVIAHSLVRSGKTVVDPALWRISQAAVLTFAPSRNRKSG